MFSKEDMKRAKFPQGKFDAAFPFPKEEIPNFPYVRLKTQLFSFISLLCLFPGLKTSEGDQSMPSFPLGIRL